MKNDPIDPRSPVTPPPAEPQDPRPVKDHLQYLLTAYLFDNLSAAGRKEVESHLAECSACSVELEELRATLGQVQDALAPPAAPAQSVEGGESAGGALAPVARYSFEARRLERVLAAARERRTVITVGWKASLGLAAAAVVAIGLLLVPTLTRTRGSRDAATGGIASTDFSDSSVEAPKLAYKVADQVPEHEQDWGPPERPGARTGYTGMSTSAPKPTAEPASAAPGEMAGATVAPAKPVELVQIVTEPAEEAAPAQADDTVRSAPEAKPAARGIGGEDGLTDSNDDRVIVSGTTPQGRTESESRRSQLAGAAAPDAKTGLSARARDARAAKELWDENGSVQSDPARPAENAPAGAPDVAQRGATREDLYALQTKQAGEGEAANKGLGFGGRLQGGRPVVVGGTDERGHSGLDTVETFDQAGVEKLGKDLAMGEAQVRSNLGNNQAPAQPSGSEEDRSKVPGGLRRDAQERPARKPAGGDKSAAPNAQGFSIALDSDALTAQINDSPANGHSLFGAIPQDAKAKPNALADVDAIQETKFDAPQAWAFKKAAPPAEQPQGKFADGIDLTGQALNRGQAFAPTSEAASAGEIQKRETKIGKRPELLGRQLDGAAKDIEALQAPAQPEAEGLVQAPPPESGKSTEAAGVRLLGEEQVAKLPQLRVIVRTDPADADKWFFEAKQRSSKSAPANPPETRYWAAKRMKERSPADRVLGTGGGNEYGDAKLLDLAAQLSGGGGGGGNLEEGKDGNAFPEPRSLPDDGLWKRTQGRSPRDGVSVGGIIRGESLGVPGQKAASASAGGTTPVANFDRSGVILNLPNGTTIAAGAVEPRLRAYDYYRSLDPSLSPQVFFAQTLEVPPPTVGDEGLGQEEFRKKYGVNPFVDTQIDHVSTFGMDVDTAAYTHARGLIFAGRLPEPKTVRVEEFVNHFREDVTTDPSAVFTVRSEGGPSPFGQGLDLLRLTVKARDLLPQERKSAVLTFAVDTSGSMGLEKRLDLVQRALETLVASLQPDDRVAIVAFGGSPYLVLPHTPARERERIVGAVRSLASSGATNVEAGLELAYRVADEVLERKAVNRVILCSDGVANVGARGPEAVLRKAEVFSKRGIYLSCVGFGMGKYNDEMLETLANRGNGNYAYVDSVAAAEDVFQKNLPATLHVLAQDAKIQVDFDPSVVAQYRLLGYENRDVADKDFRNDKVDAGEVGPGSTVTVLYELRRKTNAAGGLGKVYLRYRDTGTGRVEETNHPLPPGVLATSDKDTSDRFRFVACVAELAEVLRGSYWARNGSFVKIQRVLATVSPAFRELPEWKEVADLVGRAQALAVVQLLSRDAPDSNAAAQKGSK